MPMTAVHDLGGQPAGPIDRAEHEPTLFDQRIDAMIRLLTHPSRAVFTVDAMRRSIESHSSQEYFGLTYYEKWLHAIRRLTLEQGVISEAELARKLDQLRHRSPAGKP
ncbi:MAG: nitrile hydratase subunit beta [Betaproteobacteria bacterium]|nr:nitrile hydratase subunit beta [Betaproteobacteria bacterium]